MITVTGSVYHHRNAGVYYIWNLTIDKHVYIGSSNDVATRIKAHIYDLQNRRHIRPELQADYNRGHDFRICMFRYPRRFEDLLACEQRCMDSLRSGGWTLYNSAPAYVGSLEKADAEERQRSKAHWEWMMRDPNRAVVHPVISQDRKWSRARSYDIYFVDPMLGFDWPSPDPVWSIERGSTL